MDIVGWWWCVRSPDCLATTKQLESGFDVLIRWVEFGGTLVCVEGVVDLIIT
jgi:hypothetical protein